MSTSSVLRGSSSFSAFLSSGNWQPIPGSSILLFSAAPPRSSGASGKWSRITRSFSISGQRCMKRSSAFSSFMEQCQAFRDPRSLSCRLKQSPEICTRPASDRLARSQLQNDHRCRNVRCDFRKHIEPVYGIQDCRPGKDQIDLHAPRHQTPCADKSHTAGFRSGDHQQHESQHRSVSGRCHHRRISRRQKRTRLPDHLLQSGLQNGLAADVDPSTLYHGDGTLYADQSG